MILAQEKVSTKELFNNIYTLDIDNISPKYKYENYEQYLIFSNNVRYKFEFHPKDDKPLGYIDKLEYYFIKDSLFKSFISKDYEKDSLIVKYFNNPNNSKYLLNEILLDFSKEIIMANVIHIERKNGTVIDAHLYSYQFYDKNTFNQYGYGWTPGQPQTGYIYKKANTIPESIVSQIKVFRKSSFKTIKSIKTILHSLPNAPTRKYLIKGDYIEIIEEKGQWAKIRYYGVKISEGWIMKSEMN